MGAARAVVIDRAGRRHEAVCGDQGWLVLLPEPVRGDPPPVRFIGAQGELVAVPLAAGVRLGRVDDACAPCPVCGVGDWGA